MQATDVKEEFGSKIKYILDGGKCKIGLESTIINLTNKPSILRLGGLDVSKIKNILGKKINLNLNPKKKNSFWSVTYSLLTGNSIKNKC